MSQRVVVPPAPDGKLVITVVFRHGKGRIATHLVVTEDFLLNTPEQQSGPFLIHEVRRSVRTARAKFTAVDKGAGDGGS